MIQLQLREREREKPLPDFMFPLGTMQNRREEDSLFDFPTSSCNDEAGKQISPTALAPA